MAKAMLWAARDSPVAQLKSVPFYALTQVAQAAMLSQEPWNNAPSWEDRAEPIPVRVKEEPKSARHEILGLHGYAPKDARAETEAPTEKTRAAEARRRANPSPETTWPEKPKEEKASDDAPPAIALAEAEALTEKKRAAAPDATWPEKHKSKKITERTGIFLRAIKALETEAPTEEKPTVEAPSSGEANAAPEATWPEKPEEENAAEEVSRRGLLLLRPKAAARRMQLRPKARPFAEAGTEPPKEDKPTPVCSRRRRQPPFAAACWPTTSSCENGSSIAPWFPAGAGRRLPQTQQVRLSTAGLDVSSRKTCLRRSWKDFAWTCEVCKKVQVARKCACDNCGTPRLDVSSRKTRARRSWKDFAWKCKVCKKLQVARRCACDTCGTPRRLRQSMEDHAMERDFCHLLKMGHSELECDGCLVGSLEHLEECLRTTRPTPVFPRDPAQTELSIFQKISTPS